MAISKPLSGTHQQRALRTTLATKYLMLAVQFAQQPLSGLKGRDLADVEHAVQRLMYRGEPPTEVHEGTLNRATIDALQQRTRQLLQDLARLDVPGRIAITDDLVLCLWAIRLPDGALEFRTMGPAFARLQYQVMRLVEEVGVDKLRACHAHKPRPETGVCGRLFVKVTKKEYCSTKCQSRAWMKTESTRDPDKKGKRHGKTTR